MAQITLTDEQLRLIQSALDLFSRVGILQLDTILDHPTIDRLIHESFTEDKELEVGDDTMRGKIVEIGDDFIKTKGHWGNGEEIRTWTDVDKIKLSPDWENYHKAKDKIKDLFAEINSIIMNEQMLKNQSLGIHNSEADECRKAFDIIQSIRHEFWKADPKRSAITVDSNINLISNQPQVEVKLDDIKDIRKRKLKRLS